MKALKDTPRRIIVKRLLLLLLVILLIFGVWNAVWFFGYQQRYNQLAEHLNPYYLDDEGRKSLRYSKEVGEYSISLSMPAYLGSGGHVSIGKTEGYVYELDEEGNVIAGGGLDIELYIYPKYFTDYRLGLMFYDGFNSVMEMAVFTTDMEMENTEEMDDAYIEHINELIRENRDEITTLINIARTEWGLDIKWD